MFDRRTLRARRPLTFLAFAALAVATIATNLPASSAVGATCVPLVNGQADIASHATYTTFCLSGTHNWSLMPKTGDQFVGPAVLDGAHTTQFAFSTGSASDSVTLSNLEIRNYNPPHGLAAIQSSGSAAAAGWVLSNLNVHDNGSSVGGAGANLGVNWQVWGGRYWNNAQLGLIDSTGTGALVDGAEIDHNNFTDGTYTKRMISCSDESGGFKWFAANVTVRNSRVHDNACAGLWSDSANGGVLLNNAVYNNWNEGIFVEISSNVKVTNNTLWGNGWYGGDGSNGNVRSCNYWIYGGGISLASSDQVDIGGNLLYENCMGITGAQEPRPGAVPGQLQNVLVHDNTIAGPGGKTGFSSWPTVTMTNRNLVFTNNSIINSMGFCGVTC